MVMSAMLAEELFYALKVFLVSPDLECFLFCSWDHSIFILGC